jgi:hypothetical protein
MDCHPTQLTAPHNSANYSDCQTLKGEPWKKEFVETGKPGKQEMREIYKELGGRKPRIKGRLLAGVGGGGHRDRGGWEEFQAE